MATGTFALNAGRVEAHAADDGLPARLLNDAPGAAVCSGGRGIFLPAHEFVLTDHSTIGNAATMAGGSGARGDSDMSAQDRGCRPLRLHRSGREERGCAERGSGHGQTRCNSHSAGARNRPAKCRQSPDSQDDTLHCPSSPPALPAARLYALCGSSGRKCCNATPFDRRLGHSAPWVQVANPVSWKHIGKIDAFLHPMSPPPDHHVPDFGHILHRKADAFAAEARILDAAVGHVVDTI